MLVEGLGNKQRNVTCSDFTFSRGLSCVDQKLVEWGGRSEDGNKEVNLKGLEASQVKEEGSSWNVTSSGGEKKWLDLGQSRKWS